MRAREEEAEQSAVLGRRETRAMEARLQRLVEEIAEERGIDLVLASEAPGLLVIDGSIDITDLVVERLDGKAPEPLSGATLRDATP